MKIIYKISALFLVAISYPVVAQQSCAEYPYTDGINAEDVQGGVKILATASAAVSFDDIDSIKDAKEEAEMEAKALISNFMTEGIKSDATINKVVNESKTTSGEQSERIRKELVIRVKSLASSSQALLRGVMPLGDCYTKGIEIRVSIGIKPETIKAAGNLAGSISRSVATQPTSTIQNMGATGKGYGGATSPSVVPQSLRGQEGYSNTERLKNF